MIERRENRIGPIPQEDQNRRQAETRDHAGTEKLAPLFTERERQMLRLYNPVTGKYDLTEEEATKREARDQAVSDELERRRQERLTAWEAGVGLDKEAKHALGKFSPRAAWLFISSKVVDAVELDPEKSQQLAEDSGLFQPEGESAYQDLEDLLEVVVGIDPVKAINHFHYINPEFSLQWESLEKANALKTLEAVLRIFTVSDRWAATH